MKRLLVVLLMVAGLAVVAFASFSSRKKTATEKKSVIEKKAEKAPKTCKHSCMFS